MYELHQAGEHSYYVQSPAKIGIVKLNDTEVCLIDSGSDKDAGRRVRKILMNGAGNLLPFTTPTPMQTTLAATATSSNRLNAKSTHRELNVISPTIPFWSQPFYMVDTRRKIFATNFS